MTAEWLDQAQTRADTLSTWTARIESRSMQITAPDPNDDGRPYSVGAIYDIEDAHLLLDQVIATNRALAALRAVLEEHEPGPGPFGTYRQACAECSDPEVGLTVFWPCQTVRAIEDALA